MISAILGNSAFDGTGTRLPAVSAADRDSRISVIDKERTPVVKSLCNGVLPHAFVQYGKPLEEVQFFIQLVVILYQTI